MTSPDFQSEIDALGNRVSAVELKVGITSSATPVLQPPASFVVGVDPVTLKSTCAWACANNAVATQVHERDSDPANTLKATVPVPGGSRVSGALTPGKTYSYAGRSVASDGTVSDFSPWQLVTVPKPTAPAPPVTAPVTNGGRFPSDVIPNIALGTIMRPTGTEGSPDNGFLIGKDVPNVFFVGPDGGVVFQANAGGVHSSGSKFARSEWRQMVNAGAATPMASWSSSGDPHSMTVTESIDRSGLDGRKRIVGMQIHDTQSDVCQLMLHETAGLVLAHNNGASLEPIDPHYVDGTKFTCTFAVVADTITVTYNGAKAAQISVKGTGWYFKTGCYLQDDVPTYHASPNATGRVTVYDIQLTGGGL